jgi:hypothetical protein
MSNHNYFLLFTIKFIMTESSEIESVSMSVDPITIIIVYY